MASPSVKFSKKSKGKAVATDIDDDNDSMMSDYDTEEEDTEGAFQPHMLNGVSEFENSAKIQQMIELLQTWREQNPDDKTVIYSQWTTCLNCEFASRRGRIYEPRS